MQIRRSMTEDIISSIGLVMKKGLQSDNGFWFLWLRFLLMYYRVTIITVRHVTATWLGKQ